MRIGRTSMKDYELEEIRMHRVGNTTILLYISKDRSHRGKLSKECQLHTLNGIQTLACYFSPCSPQLSRD